jgi:hypothetical protein
MSLCYQIILILLYQSFIEGNLHIMPSYISSTHECLSDKYIGSILAAMKNIFLATHILMILTL